MKKAIRLIFALAMTLGLMIALAAPAQAALVTHTKAVGGSAFWSMYDEATGVWTYVWVDAQDGVPETRRSVGISISQIQYDGNDNVPVRDIWFYGELPAGCLVVSHNLTSAGLIVSGLQGTQYDYGTGTETAVTIDLNVTWVADGPLSNYHYNYHWRYPGEFVYNRGIGKSRDGSATGELTLDGFIMPLIVDNVEAGEEAYASIASTKDGHLSIGH